jgi:hypothetical protein
MQVFATANADIFLSEALLQVASKIAKLKYQKQKVTMFITMFITQFYYLSTNNIAPTIVLKTNNDVHSILVTQY